MQARVEGFKLSLIDELWDYGNLDFDGAFVAEVLVGDLFKQKEIRASITADTMLVNGDDWGGLRIDANMPSTKHPVQAYVSITDNNKVFLNIPPKAHKFTYDSYGSKMI